MTSNHNFGQDNTMTRQILDRKDFKLGLFSSNCSGGLAVTKIDERWGATWEENLAMAKAADRLGFDFLLPSPAGSATRATPTSTAASWTQ